MKVVATRQRSPTGFYPAGHPDREAGSGSGWVGHPDPDRVIFGSFQAGCGRPVRDLVRARKAGNLAGKPAGRWPVPGRVLARPGPGPAQPGPGRCKKR